MTKKSNKNTDADQTELTGFFVTIINFQEQKKEKVLKNRVNEKLLAYINLVFLVTLRTSNLGWLSCVYTRFFFGVYLKRTDSCWNFRRSLTVRWKLCCSGSAPLDPLSLRRPHCYHDGWDLISWFPPLHYMYTKWVRHARQTTLILSVFVILFFPSSSSSSSLSSSSSPSSYHSISRFNENVSADFLATTSFSFYQFRVDLLMPQ